MVMKTELPRFIRQQPPGSLRAATCEAKVSICALWKVPPLELRPCWIHATLHSATRGFLRFEGCVGKVITQSFTPNFQQLLPDAYRLGGGQTTLHFPYASHEGLSFRAHFNVSEGVDPVARLTVVWRSFADMLGEVPAPLCSGLQPCTCCTLRLMGRPSISVFYDHWLEWDIDLARNNLLISVPPHSSSMRIKAIDLQSPPGKGPLVLKSNVIRQGRQVEGSEEWTLRSDLGLKFAQPNPMVRSFASPFALQLLQGDELLLASTHHFETPCVASLCMLVESECIIVEDVYQELQCYAVARANSSALKIHPRREDEADTSMITESREKPPLTMPTMAMGASATPPFPGSTSPATSTTVVASNVLPSRRAFWFSARTELEAENLIQQSRARWFSALHEGKGANETCSLANEWLFMEEVRDLSRRLKERFVIRDVMLSSRALPRGVLVDPASAAPDFATKFPELAEQGFNNVLVSDAQVDGIACFNDSHRCPLRLGF